ncbi:MAG: hydrogenase maturation nickel metallochaperone HypA/HybF [Planctomycetota bacterium]|jgi:hydrogenase nickel incorporation protein HypA/HybF
MSLAVELINQIIKSAGENNLSRIDEIEIEAGELKLVVPDLIQNAFEVVSVGTIAEGAVLKIIEVKALVKCRKCGKEFRPEIDNFLCPECEIADFDIIRGNDIVLNSLVCYEDDENEEGSE